MSTETPAMDRNITAFFDTREAAEQAITQMVETGLPRDKILLRVGAARKAAFVDEGKGLLQEVKELILPSEEPDSAVEALKHEGFLLSVRPEPEAHDAVFKLLEQAGGKGAESREDVWPDWKSGHDDTSEEYPEGDTEDSSPPGAPAGAAKDPAATEPAGLAVSEAVPDNVPRPDPEVAGSEQPATSRGT